MKFRIIFSLQFGLILAGEPVLASAQTTARPAAEFLDTLGACSAVSRRGEDLTHTTQAVRFLGLRWIRAGYEGGIPVADLIELHRQTGVLFSYGLASGGTNISRLLDGARQLAAAGALLAFEGNNEPNNWGVTYHGRAGGGRLSWLPVAQQQAELYSRVKADPALQAYPVWSPSEIGGETDNVGLQFLTIPEGSDCLMPAGTKFADAANCHNYLIHPGWPGLHDNQTWVAADPTASCRVDGLYGNHGLTWAKHYHGYSASALLTLPRVTTETGVTIGGTITEEVQARLYLSMYLDQFKRGWSRTCIYLLRDRSDEAGNQTYGFYQPDYTPRKAAIYLHNLTTILNDFRGNWAPESLPYSIPNEPASVHDLLLQKHDGTFELVFWDEHFASGSDHFNIELAAPHPSVKVYDPTQGVSPVQSFDDVRSVSLTLSDHPVVVEVPR